MQGGSILIKNNKFLVALMSFFVLTFGQYLVSAMDSDNVVVVEAPSKIGCFPSKEAVKSKGKASGEFKGAELEDMSVEVADETADMHDVCNYLLKYHPKKGSDGARLLALLVLSRRLKNIIELNREWVNRYYSGVINNSAAKYIDDKFYKNGDVLGIIKRFDGYEDVEGFYLEEGLAKKINYIFKTKQGRDEILKPITKSEFKEIKDFALKKLMDVGDDVSYSLSELEQHKQSHQELEDGKRCDRLASFKGLYKYTEEKLDYSKKRYINVVECLNKINDLTFDELNGVYASFFEEGCSVDLLEQITSKEVDKYGRPYSYVNYGLQKALELKNAAYCKIKFNFNNPDRFINLFANLVLLEAIKKYKGDGFFGDDMDFIIPEASLKDGVVYRVYESPEFFYGMPRFLNNLLNGEDEDNYINFGVMAKDDKTLEDFVAKFPKIVSEVSKKITEDDINSAVFELIDILCCSCKLRFETLLRFEDEEFISSVFRLDFKGQPKIYSDYLISLAGIYSQGLINVFDVVDVDSENFKKAYKKAYTDSVEKLYPNFDCVPFDCVPADFCDTFVDFEKFNVTMADVMNLVLNLVGYIDGFGEVYIDELRSGFNLDRIYKGGCCVCCAGWKLKQDIIDSVKAIFANDALKPGFVIAEKKESSFNPHYLRQLDNVFATYYDFYSFLGDVAFIASLKNTNSAEFELVRQDLFDLKQRFDDLSFKTNIEKLTPEQRHIVLLENFLFCNRTARGVSDLSKYPFKNDPELEVDVILYSSVKIGKYIDMLLGALDKIFG